MKVAIDCDLQDGWEASHSLRGWLEQAEAGEMDGDEMLHRLGGIIDLLDETRSNVRRALGR